MIIELHGGQFANRGAHKMLMTTMDQLARRIPDARFVVDRCVGDAAQRRAAGLDTLLFKRGWMGQRRFGTCFASQRLAAAVNRVVPIASRGTVPLDRVEALVDLAGFSYSDQWGARPIRDFASLAGHYASRSRPVILLPQALGPFDMPASARSFAKLAKAATLIHARDRESLAFARAAAPEAENIVLCPDLTLPVGAVETAVPADTARVAYFIPNTRMLHQGGLMLDDYAAAMAAAARSIACHVEPRLLVHDGGGQDEKIARRIAALAGLSVRVEIIEDPWQIKDAIGGALFVVGSRFHGLVAALSKAVPVVAVGWSHKYQQLLDDFSCGDFIVPAKDLHNALVPLVMRLTDREANNMVRARLQSQIQHAVREVEAMWDRVVTKIVTSRD